MAQDHQILRVVTVASDVAWKDPAANLASHDAHIQAVMKKWPATQIIVFPEISLMGAVIDDTLPDIAEPLDGPTITKLRAIAAKHNVAVAAGFIEANPDGKPHNCTVVASGAGELLTHYHKNHLFSDSPEPELYAPGADLAVFELDGWKIGVSICFDIRFPRLFEAYKAAGVECMISGFNWVKGRNKPAIMEHLVKARAHENQYCFAAVDRSGSDPYTTYYGTSVLSNPYCEDIAERDGLYAYAEFDKQAITELATNLPLKPSYKTSYEIRRS